MLDLVHHSLSTRFLFNSHLSSRVVVKLTSVFQKRSLRQEKCANSPQSTHLVEMGFRFYLNGREICLQSEDLNFLGSCTLFSQRRNILAA